MGSLSLGAELNPEESIERGRAEGIFPDES